MPGAREIDLNADAGEGFGAWSRGEDASLFGLVTSVNLACGFHAGDPGTMRRAASLARERGVAVGAHVGYPDLVGFGRRELGASPEEVHDDTVYQVGALAGFLRLEGLALHHVKPHGALYNRLALDEPLARAVARAVAAVAPDAPLVVLAGSPAAAWARDEGVRVVEELFADRGYGRDGRLLSRSEPGALVLDPAVVAERVVRMVVEGTLETAGGQIAVAGATVCFHGDTPGAADLVRAARWALEAAGVRVRAF